MLHKTCLRHLARPISFTLFNSSQFPRTLGTPLVHVTLIMASVIQNFKYVFWFIYSWNAWKLMRLATIIKYYISIILFWIQCKEVYSLNGSKIPMTLPALFYGVMQMSTRLTLALVTLNFAFSPWRNPTVLRLKYSQISKVLTKKLLK